MFHKLEVNDEEVPEGQQVRFIRATDSWWDRPAEGSSYVFAALFIALGALLGILVAALI